MSAIETTTDMRSFEGALDEEFCHTLIGSPAVSLCGAPFVRKGPHVGYVFRPICDGCGRRNCPDCAAEWQRRGL